VPRQTVIQQNRFERNCPAPESCISCDPNAASWNWRTGRPAGDSTATVAGGDDACLLGGCDLTLRRCRVCVAEKVGNIPPGAASLGAAVDSMFTSD